MSDVRTVEQIQDGEITRKFLDHMWESWKDRDTASFLDSRMRKLEAQARRNFIEVGLICMEMSERSLWKDAFDPETGECFASMDSWLSSAAPVSRSSAYEAMRVLKALPNLSADQMKEIPRVNLRTLTGLSSKVGQDAEVLQAARELPERKFREKIQAEYPDQKIEQTDGMWLNFTTSARSVFTDAIEAAMKNEECKSKEEAAEFLAVTYLNEVGWPKK